MHLLAATLTHVKPTRVQCIDISVVLQVRVTTLVLFEVLPSCVPRHCPLINSCDWPDAFTWLVMTWLVAVLEQVVWTIRPLLFGLRHLPLLPAE